MYATQIIRSCIIGLILVMELAVAAQPLAPSRVFRLPVWQEAGEWASRQQLSGWQVRDIGGAEQYLISRVDEGHWQRLQEVCGADIQCTSDSCQQVRSSDAADRWLVPRPPDLLASLAGDPWECAESGVLRWQGQQLEQPACWALQQGRGCEAVLTPMAVLQPMQRQGRLLVLLPAGEHAAELSQVLEMEVVSVDYLASISATLVQLSSAQPGRLAEAQRWLITHRPELLHQPDLLFESRLQRAAGGAEGVAAAMFDMAVKAQISVGLIDTGVALTGSDEQLVTADFTGAGYRAGETGTALASVLALYLESMSLFSYQACVPARGGFAAACYSSALIRSLNQALLDKNRLVQLGPVGPGGAILHHLVRQALLRGVVLVAGVGDAGAHAPPLYPAAWPEVLAVTAVQGGRQRLPIAVTGGHIDLAAAGANLSVFHQDRSQRLLSGTGLAAAHVTGVVARLLQAGIPVSPVRLYEYLRESSDDIGQAGADPEFGAGLLNPCRALRLIAPLATGCQAGAGL